jgi:methylated-DNA-[protein]-cysteine S-methyltransferase
VGKRCVLGLTYAELSETPLGPISFIAGDRGLQRVAFSSLHALKETAAGSGTEPSLGGLQTLSGLIQEVNAYFFGLQKTFSMDVDWAVLQGFQSHVLARTAEIPFGEVMTYGDLAQELGAPGSARAVGRALGANPMPLVIPCHRVIGSDLRLCGYAGGLEKKAYLLELEGHMVEKDQLQPNCKHADKI